MNLRCLKSAIPLGTVLWALILWPVFAQPVYLDVCLSMTGTKAQKAKGKRNGQGVRCRCYETVEPPPEEYIIKACGLRKTKSAKKPSRYQCVTSTLTLPVTDPVTVELDFGR